MEKTSTRWLLWLYGTTVVISLFTGFGNMPLWGRYYIADIPGLGWLFKTKSKGDRKEELLIFLTPKIVPSV